MTRKHFVGRCAWHLDRKVYSIMESSSDLSWNLHGKILHLVSIHARQTGKQQVHPGRDCFGLSVRRDEGGHGKGGEITSAFRLKFEKLPYFMLRITSCLASSKIPTWNSFFFSDERKRSSNLFRQFGVMLISHGLPCETNISYKRHCILRNRFRCRICDSSERETNLSVKLWSARTNPRCSCQRTK